MNFTNPVVWVHGDCLSPTHPALLAYPTRPALWVWDEALLEEWQLRLKRLVFIYECLLELPVVIRRGEVAAEVIAFAQEHQADGVLTTASPSPRFQVIRSTIESTLPVTVLPVEPLVAYDGFLDLKSFSRYWRVAESYAFQASTPTPDLTQGKHPPTPPTTPGSAD
ncbi:hypothetical protein [Anthocerotibacter panamensis]|uniref:hypothetical protein n=1 Tax=Anthocerotibacter panamensis TaxID=2857077 RepID=UPI001C408583|nr:hypothetical protein [Anthocerotibacter panamensis]